jgi:hypothetical protein
MKDLLNKKYSTIIDKYMKGNFGEVLKRGYVFQYDENEKNSELLFIGMNPSYTEKYEGGKTFADNYTRDVDRSYFKAFHQINQELIDANIGYNGIFTHFDLMVFRETKQNFINRLMKDPIGSEFIMEQLEIAKERFINISPKVVVVSNAKSRDFLGRYFSKDAMNEKELNQWMDFEFDFDEEYGSRRVINVPELMNTHFLFSSMLSGQRALDLGSKERLVWQIKQILKKPKNL